MVICSWCVCRVCISTYADVHNVCILNLKMHIFVVQLSGSRRTTWVISTVGATEPQQGSESYRNPTDLQTEAVLFWGLGPNLTPGPTQGLQETETNRISRFSVILSTAWCCSTETNSPRDVIKRQFCKGVRSSPCYPRSTGKQVLY